jgi:hypothetical protein
MTKEEVLATVAAHREALQELGVKSLELFGSVARGEATTESDVDFLVELVEGSSLFDLSRIRFYLEDILGCSVDIGTKRSLREELKEAVLRDAVYVF